jgi:hypothetical protein
LLALEYVEVGDSAAQEPMTLALAAAGCELALPYLADEFQRRCRRHPGVRAAMLLLGRDLDEGHEGRGRALLAVIGPLVGAVAKRTRRRRRSSPVGSSFLRGHRKSPGHEHWCATLDAEATSQLAMTVFERWGSRPSLAVLADALDGKLNIAARAAADDIADQARGAVGPSLPPRVPRRDQDQAELVVEFEIASDEPRPDDRAVAKVTLDRVRATAEGEALCQAMEQLGAEPTEGKMEALGNVTQGELAAAIGRSDRTIRNWRDRLRERFWEGRAP